MTYKQTRMRLDASRLMCDPRYYEPEPGMETMPVPRPGDLDAGLKADECRCPPEAGCWRCQRGKPCHKATLRLERARAKRVERLARMARFWGGHHGR